MSPRATPRGRTRRLVGILLGGARPLVGAAVVLGVLAAFAWVVRPDISRPPTAYTPEELAEAEALRDVRLDPNHPVIVHVEVPQADRDRARAFYPEGKDSVPADLAEELVAQGKLPGWYPRGESPLLAELVREGALPPVAERVGPEPAVLKGVDGIGEYGGTWLRAGVNANEAVHFIWMMSSCGLFQWSPQGYPIRPHFAKGLEALPGGREFLLTLRKGLRYSDGHEVDANDIMYYWQCEILNEVYGGSVPPWMQPGGKPGTIRRLDKYRLKFTFQEPYGLFPEILTRHGDILYSPEHYLRPYHPDPKIGDERKINEVLRVHRLGTRRAVYTLVAGLDNPELPSLRPWLYRTRQTVPPIVLVRNPYYGVVDAHGSQLPYLDQVLIDVKLDKMLPQTIAGGKISMQVDNVRYRDYTELMSRRKQNGYEVLHWYPGQRSNYVIFPNLIRVVHKGDPATRWKAKLLAEKRFRQALSLAIDRRQCIRAEYKGQGTPSQVSPGRGSPFRHEKSAAAFVEHDPARAGGLLDGLWRDLGGDLARRDGEGFRTFPDGTRMTFYLDYCENTGFGPSQFVVDDWAKVALRVLPRHRSRSLFVVEKNTADFDLNVYYSGFEFMPLLSARLYVPTDAGAYYATRWGSWYYQGGFYKAEGEVTEYGAIPVPGDHPMHRAIGLFEKARQASTLPERKRIFDQVLDIAAENVWSLSIATAPPALAVVRDGFRNVPRKALAGEVMTPPSHLAPETFFFEHEADRRHTPGARAAILAALRAPDPLEPRAVEVSTGGSIIRWMVLGVGVLFVLLAAARHPYVARRLLIMVPTLLIISVGAFVIIQLPPGDFLTARIVQLEEAGIDSARVQEELNDLKRMFHYDEPAWKQYGRWMGLYWFATFDEKDAGLLQGNLGRSMETLKEINSVIGDRIVLTFFISLGTILFTWAVAIPIGIYSAVRQYSVGDYVFTFVGFVGMCIPGFLLALVLAAVTDIEGLFSAEYVAQPEWDLGKFVDLLKHIWIPVVVMGVTGTAGMIRVMRANLLDELKKPYVVTAMAKGVRPVKLLFKYPVRMALNPFISTIGGLFPALVSGGSIVAIVLSLPTVGPLMINALFSQDMYTAGSMLMVLSLLGVLGTLVSDLLLLWLDPRIRFRGGSR